MTLTHRANSIPPLFLAFSRDAQRSAVSAAATPQALPFGPSINACCTRSRSRGFSFTEILFAVIVLGIGFIMIAAIFPVAIQQGKLTSEQGSATAVAREALNYLGQVGANSDSISNAAGGPLFPATGVAGGASPHLGTVLSFRDISPTGTLNSNQNPSNNALLLPVTGRTVDELWNRLNLSLVVPSDQRFAFVGLYRRNGDPNDRRTWSPFVQAWFIPVTTRSRSIYNPGTLSTPGTDLAGTRSNLQARLVKVSIDLAPLSNYSTSAPGSYVLYNWSGAVAPTTPGGNYQPSALSENSYVIIADDKINYPLVGTPTPVNVNLGRMNGHIYHVGLRRPDLDATLGSNSVTAYDLVPDGGFAPDPGANGYFDNPMVTTADDILTVGMMQPGPGTSPASPFTGFSPYGNASAPADAYVVGVDDSPGADPGTSQDISAFTTFIKVN